MRRLYTLLVAAVVATLTLTGSASATGGGRAWVGTWSTAVTGAATPPQPATVFENQTLRQIVHVTFQGEILSAARCRMVSRSNAAAGCRAPALSSGLVPNRLLPTHV